MDRKAIAKLCLAGSDKQIADQLYLLKKAREIIGKKESGSHFMYRLPTESDMPPSITPAEVLRARSEAEVDEIDIERIEEATEIIRMVEEISDAPKKLPPREDIERMIAEKPINGNTQEQPESDVSETVADKTELVVENSEESIEEPISEEVSRFRVGVYSDETMVLERPDEELFEIDKAEFAVMVAFARTVGWLA